MRFKTSLLALGFILSLSHCVPYDFSRRYVQQGNLLPPAKIARLHVGMTKQDVAILMGTSLLSPTFTNQRWDYAYSWRKGSSKPQVRYVVLHFTGERLTNIEHRP